MPGLVTHPLDATEERTNMKPSHSSRLLCCHPACEADAHPDIRFTPLCGHHAAGVYRKVADILGPIPEEKRTAWRPSKETPGLVYFIRFGDRVKIGYTTSLNVRMREVPHDELLGTIPGTMTTEARLHRRFADLRITGEWFRDDTRIRAAITEGP